MTKPARYTTMPTLEKLQHIIAWAEEKKGKDLFALDLSTCHSLVEATCIITATSARHAQGLAEFISEQCRVHKFEQLRMEGFQNALWILLDLNDIMVHIMQPEARAEYRLDTLWPKAITVADQREGE